jgi:diguanylate cyclase (GGDEF)-like protein
VNQIKSADIPTYIPLGEPDGSLPGLIAGVVALTECLEKALCGKVGAEAVGVAVGSALAAAKAAEKTIAEQQKHLAHFERLAVTDELTGLLNRRGFEAEIRRTTAAVRRYNEKGVLIFIDLDGFKPINDSFGHAAGDAVLRHVAKLLGDNVRATDSLGRLGGDEFAILLTRTTWEAGLQRAEAFDALINGAGVQWAGQTITIRASFGFQTYGPDDDLGQLLVHADNAMYAIKRARAAAGPNRANA